MRPDRREVLAMGAAALAAARLPRGAGPRPAIRKAVKYGMVQLEGSVRDKLELLAEIGFDGVEMDSPSDLDPEEVLAARDASGLAIPGVVDSAHWRLPLSDPDPDVRARGRAALETALRDCARFGGSSVLLVPAVVGAGVGYDEAWTRSQAEIRRVLPLAEELGVDVAIENVWNHFLLSPLEAARYVDELESPRVGWHLDLGNVVTYGWPEQWVRILGKRIRKLDVKDFSRAKRDAEGLWKGFEVEIGAGDVDWPAVLRALDAIGWSGWASAEVAGGPPERLRDVAARMERVLAL
jgi:hexulose-6-phosphate isomerase